MTGLGASAKRVLPRIFTGITAAGAVAKLVELGKAAADSGLKALQAEAAFRRDDGGARRQRGPDARANAARVQGGLADETDTMLASARGLQQGLSQSQLVQVLDLATNKAKLAGVSVAQAYSMMSDAIAENSVRSLKRFGIVLDVNDVMKKYAATLGTFPEALSQAEERRPSSSATMEAAAKQTRAATTAMDENLERLERNRNRTASFWADVGKVIVNAHGELLAFWQDFDKAAEEMSQRLVKQRRVRPEPSGFAPGASGRARGRARHVRYHPRPAQLTPVAIPPEVIAAPDLLKRALAEADHALTMLNATAGRGRDDERGLRGGGSGQITKLQALGSTIDEAGTLKLLGFRRHWPPSTSRSFSKPRREPASHPSLGVGPDRQRGRNRSPSRIPRWSRGRWPEANIRVAMLAADRMRLAQALAAFQGNEAQKFQLEQQYAALGLQLAEAEEHRADRGLVEGDGCPQGLCRASSTRALMRVSAGDAGHRRVRARLAGSRRSAEEVRRCHGRHDGRYESGASDGFDRAAPKPPGRPRAASITTSPRSASLLQLMGPNFDSSGAAIARMQQRLVDLTNEAEGDDHPGDGQSWPPRSTASSTQKRLDERPRASRAPRSTSFVDLARSTAQSMSSAFSDLFFNIFTGNLKSAADIFKAFALSMPAQHRELSGERVTQQFLGFSVRRGDRQLTPLRRLRAHWVGAVGVVVVAAASAASAAAAYSAATRSVGVALAAAGSACRAFRRGSLTRAS
mgnify:CR=1 FL=1